MGALELLVKTRELLSRPHRWTRGAYARRQYGETCGPLHPDAYSFCSVGALRYVNGGDSGGYTPALRWLDAAGSDNVVNTLTTSLSVWNDALGRTHDEVVARFDRAIELAKESRCTPIR